MTKLSDTQCILLSNAAQRDDGSVYPLPSTLKPGGGTTKAVEALVARGFAKERETSNTDAVRRADGDIRYGVFMTSAGAAAIGVARLPVNLGLRRSKYLPQRRRRHRRIPWLSAC